MTDLTPPAPASPLSLRRLTTKLAATVLVAAPLALVMVPAPALAGECAKQTGGSNDRVMWTGKGFTCAYVANSGKKKIGSWKTHTWTSNTALGYKKKDHRWKHTGGVDISYMYYGSDLGSSITFTAINTASGSRHWGANVLWHTSKAGNVAGNQYKGKKYDYQVNRFHVTKISASGAETATVGSPVPYTIKVTDPDGRSTPTGAVLLFQQVGSKPNPPVTNCDGTSTNGQPGFDRPIGRAALSQGAATVVAPPNLLAGSHRLYAVYTGTQIKDLPMYCAAPPNDGLTGAQTSSWTLTLGAPASVRAVDARGVGGSPRVVAAERATVIPHLDLGTLPGPSDGSAPVAVVQHRFVVGRTGTSPRANLACPPGYAPVQVNAASPNRVLPERVIEGAGARTRLRRGIAPAGTKIDVQVVCRPRSGRVIAAGRTVLGTVAADRLVTDRKRSTVLAGAGADRIRLTKPGSAAFGFTGRDRIVITARRAAAHGGPGNDRIVARKPGKVLIVGGLGRDTLIGARGRTFINAQDGSGGDRVICRSSRNLVRADPGDVLVGPCTVVGR